MTQQIVYLPALRSTAERLREGSPPGHEWRGHTGTPDLRRAHELGPDEMEEAEYLALCYAGVAVLLIPGDEQRLVLAAELPPDLLTPMPEDPFGTVEVAEVRWTDVRAVFVHDSASTGQVARAGAAVTGLSLTDAVDHPEVAALLQSADLLWYDPAELDQLG